MPEGIAGSSGVYGRLPQYGMGMGSGGYGGALLLPGESPWSQNFAAMNNLMGMAPQRFTGGGGNAPGLNLPAGWASGGGGALVSANPGIFGGGTDMYGGALVNSGDGVMRPQGMSRNIPQNTIMGPGQSGAAAQRTRVYGPSFGLPRYNGRNS